MTSVTEEQEYVLANEVGEIRSVMRRFLQGHDELAQTAPIPSVAMGLDRGGWERATTELGLAGLLVPTDLGGTDLDYRCLDAVMQEAGRTLWRAPLLSTTVLVGTVLRHGPRNEAIRELADGVVSGAQVVTVAVPVVGIDAGVDVRAGTTSEGLSPESWSLEGRVTHVLDAPDSDGFLVPARVEGDETRLFWVKRQAPGVSVAALPGVDVTRGLGHLTLDRSPGRLLVEHDVIALLARVVDAGRIALAAESTGSASRLLDDGVTHVKQRYQFGVPVGSFQAVKHRLADTFMAVENARSAVGHGAWALDREPGEVPIAAAMAAAVAAETHEAAGMTSIQVHGGIGVTWEHRTHVHLKRAKTAGCYFGSPREHRGRLADLLGL